MNKTKESKNVHSKTAIILGSAEGVLCCRQSSIQNLVPAAYLTHTKVMKWKKEGERKGANPTIKARIPLDVEVNIWRDVDFMKSQRSW